MKSKRNLEQLNKKIQWIQIIATLSGSLVKLTTGLMLGWSSPSLPKLEQEEPYLLSKDESFLVANFLNIGQCFAIPIVALTVDVIGRKNGILFCIVPIIVSWVLVAFSETFELLCFARFIGGLGTGYGKTVIGMYTSEIAQPEIRGALGTVTSVMTRFGILFIFSLGPFVTITTMALISSIFSFIMFLTFLWMPKSPYFLLLRGKVDEAKKSLSLLRRRTNIIDEFTKIQDSITKQKPFLVVFKKLIFIPSNRKAFVIICLLFIFDQFSGMAAVLVYSQTIFEHAGTQFSPAICSCITLVCQIFSLLICITLVDKCGRRPILILSCIGVSLSLAILSVYFYIDKYLNYDITYLHWIPLIALLVYHFLFMIGIGSLPLIIQGELFPTDVKAVAVSLSALTSPLLGIIVTKIFQVLTDNFGEFSSFAFFSTCSTIGAIFVLIWVPETKGMSLEDIQKILENSKNSNNNDVHSVDRNNKIIQKGMIIPPLENSNNIQPIFYIENPYKNILKA